MELGDRPCFHCGKVGHQSRNCPEKVGQTKNSTEALDGEDENYLGCFGDAEGFIPAHRKRSSVVAAAARRRASEAHSQEEFDLPARPRGCTLGDCFQKRSVFSLLAMVEGLDRSNIVSESEEQGASSLMSHPKAKLHEGVPASAVTETTI